MTITGSGNTKTVTDGIALLGEAALNTQFTFSGNNPRLQIIARGDFAGEAWPKMELKIAGVLYASIDIDSATWKTFILDPHLSPGLHDISFAFVNDYYVAPADRNFFMDKVTITDTPPAEPGSVTVAWDANTEPDLEGYKIHTGAVSRMADTATKMEQWCAEHEPTNTKCVEEWQAICKDKEDQACHSMLHGYDYVHDVKNVNEYRIVNLREGTRYFLAATAYDLDKNESLYSDELDHTVGFRQPGQGNGLRYKDIVHWFKWSSAAMQELLSHKE